MRKTPATSDRPETGTKNSAAKPIISASLKSTFFLLAERICIEVSKTMAPVIKNIIASSTITPLKPVLCKTENRTLPFPSGMHHKMSGTKEKRVIYIKLRAGDGFFKSSCFVTSSRPAAKNSLNIFEMRPYIAKAIPIAKPICTAPAAVDTEPSVLPANALSNDA